MTAAATETQLRRGEGERESSPSRRAEQGGPGTYDSRLHAAAAAATDKDAAGGGGKATPTV